MASNYSPENPENLFFYLSGNEDDRNREKNKMQSQQ